MTDLNGDAKSSPNHSSVRLINNRGNDQIFCFISGATIIAFQVNNLAVGKFLDIYRLLPVSYFY